MNITENLGLKTLIPFLDQVKRNEPVNFSTLCEGRRRGYGMVSRYLRYCLGHGLARANEMMEGAEELSPSSSDEEVIDWTRGAMGRLEAIVDEEKEKEIMAACACQYPRERLEHMREKYADTGDLSLVHGMLQEQFLTTTKWFLRLDEEQLEDIERRGWGIAGVRKGDTIIATKTPFQFHEYFKAEDPQERRYRYCHCPVVREIIRAGGEPVSNTYCYCGAGFYKGIWEYILQRPVRVEVLESVLGGDDLYRIAIHPSLDT